MSFLQTYRASRIAPIFLLALASVAYPQNPVAHVDVKTMKSYEGQQQLPKPDRVVIFDFAVNPEAIKVDQRPGIRQRVTNVTSSEDAATLAGEQVQNQITKDLLSTLQKRLSASGVAVEKGTRDMPISGNTIVVNGTIESIDQGHHIRREAVGLGAGASEVKTSCQVTMQTSGNKVSISEFTTDAKSGKKPGAAVTMGAGAAPDVAAGATGATAHKSTAEGDAVRTGSALANHIADWMKTQGWIPSASPSTKTGT